MEIKGKRAVVVAGARGIGLAYCWALLQKGAKVFVGDILGEEGSAAVREMRAQFGDDAASFSAIDVTKQADVEEFFRRAVSLLGGVDIVVGNAGILDEQDWERNIDVNLKGQIRVTLEALKVMGRDAGGSGGVLVLTASQAAVIPVAITPTYAAAKHGVVGFARSWAMRFKEHGVRINCICPTITDTKIFDDVDKVLDPDDSRRLLRDVKPFMLRPEEVAAALVEMIEEEKFNGSVMFVCREKGRFPVEFVQMPAQ